MMRSLHQTTIQYPTSISSTSLNDDSSKVMLVVIMVVAIMVVMVVAVAVVVATAVAAVTGTIVKQQHC